MSKAEQQGDWHRLYRDALLEPEPANVYLRIEQAQQEIYRRALELWFTNSPETKDRKEQDCKEEDRKKKERKELDNALHFLRLLRTVGPLPIEQPQVSQIDEHI